jgi:phage/plasmid-associated DNA primase
VGKSSINSLFLSTIINATQKLINDLPKPDPEKEEDVADYKKKVKSALKFNSYADGSATTAVSAFLPSFCCGDTRSDPSELFNKNADSLPLENGVWVFSEKLLRAYEREDYFTKRIEISYNPDADTSLIEKAMTMWFQSRADVIRFVRYYVGYLLTGYTTRQDFLCVWGTKAGNGKTFLFDELLTPLLGGKDGFAHPMTMEAFSANGGANNDELYNSNGKRYGLIDEPKEIAKLSDAVFKLAVGSKTLTASAKYKTAISFKNLMKLVVLCNQLPDWNLSDQGMLRRLLVLEMKTAFLDSHIYEKASEEQKAAGLVQLKNDEFTNKLIENREGLLKYFMGGADDYIDNPRLPPPESMLLAKEKAKTELDALGSWMTSNLRNLPRETINAKKVVTLKDLRALWLERKIDLPGMRKHGFNGKFLEHAEMLGYKVYHGDPKKARQRLEYCELIDEAEEDSDDENEIVM